MQFKKRIAFTILVLGISLGVFSQENSDSLSFGKPILRIFSNYHSSFSNDAFFNQFELTRAYLGYEHQFNTKWSARLVFDVGNPKDSGSHQMSAFVKNAFVKYKNAGWSVSFGLIGTNTFNIQEKSWGYRYILKSFQDNYKFGSSADLGISGHYNFNKLLSADLILVNGEGYKKIEQDTIFTMGAGVTVHPLERLTLRAYYETTTLSNDSVKRQNTLALFAAYRVKRIMVGAEYNVQTNRGMTEGMDLDGFSFYTTLQVKSSKLFARYDVLQSKKDWNVKTDGQLFVFGAEFNPTKGIKISPNFRNISPSERSLAAVNYLYINFEVNF